MSDELRGTTFGGGDPISPSGVNVEAPTRYFMDHDADGIMCLWLDYGPGDEFPVCLLREGSIAPELWDAAVRMLIVDDASVYQVALAIHHAADSTYSQDEPKIPFTLVREIRMMQARAAIRAFGAIPPEGE